MRGPLVWAAAYGAACALVALAMWGFTVDDALISVRYAHNLATGHGYRWNISGPSTDGVTPLPWPFLLEPLAGGDALTTLARAKMLGLLSWFLSASTLGFTVGRRDIKPWMKAAALLLLLSSLPISAHASSGMETALVMALLTVSAALHARPWASTVCAAVSVAFRPELMPWALAWTAGRCVSQGATRKSTALHVAASVAPFLGCAIARALVFGHPYPLAVLAKPSDIEHGAAYVGAGLIVCVLPVACVAPWTLARGQGVARALGIAFVVHALVVMLVGGDWMPYSRLLAPVVPGLVLVFLQSAPRWSVLARAGLGIAIGANFWVRAAPAGMGVQADREKLVAEARPMLRSCKRVAAVDVGWVSAAVDVDIVDLAGLTDPFIAALPGGHTSKRVDAGMLIDRGVDCAVFYVDEGQFSRDPRDMLFAHAVSERLAESAVFESHYAARSKVQLGSGDRGYVLFTETSDEERRTREP